MAIGLNKGFHWFVNHPTLGLGLFGFSDAPEPEKNAGNYISLAGDFTTDLWLLDTITESKRNPTMPGS